MTQSAKSKLINNDRNSDQDLLSILGADITPYTAAEQKQNIKLQLYSLMSCKNWRKDFNNLSHARKVAYRAQLLLRKKWAVAL